MKLHTAILEGTRTPLIPSLSPCLYAWEHYAQYCTQLFYSCIPWTLPYYPPINVPSIHQIIPIILNSLSGNCNCGKSLPYLSAKLNSQQQKEQVSLISVVVPQNTASWLVLTSWEHAVCLNILTGSLAWIWSHHTPVRIQCHSRHLALNYTCTLRHMMDNGNYAALLSMIPDVTVVPIILKNIRE